MNTGGNNIHSDDSDDDNSSSMASISKSSMHLSVKKPNARKKSLMVESSNKGAIMKGNFTPANRALTLKAAPPINVE